MREMKFRAWDVKKNSMIKIFLLWADGHESVDSRKKGFHIMQFTGLLDRNGKEVYEGDIYIQYAMIGGKLVPLGSYYPKDKNQSIAGKTFKVGYKTVEWSSWHDGGSIGFSLPPNPSKYIEVVGNIYENKELLDEPQ